jgi:hypothetical protein
MSAISAILRQLSAACLMTTVLTAGASAAWAMPEDAQQQPSQEATQAMPANISASGTATPAPAATKPGQTTSPAPSPHLPTVRSRAGDKLSWNDLTPAQKKALEPLAPEWNNLTPDRKTKWLTIANKYHTMQPAEQERIQARMREWIKLTPEQRRIARESYARAKKLNPEQKSAQWEQYQQLPEEHKKQLATNPMPKPLTTTPPPPSQAKGNTVPPIKSASRPALEQSLTPRTIKQTSVAPDQQPAQK